MKLFIDSSQKTFVAAIFNDDFKVIQARIYETKFKVEAIIDFFDEVLNVEELNEIYINIGPGSFTGSRSSLLYVRTLVQLNPNIKLYTTTTFDILKKQTKPIIFSKKIFYISATKNKSYCMAKKEVKLVEKSKKEREIEYEKMVATFATYLPIFKPAPIESLEPFYVSSPQIGKI